MSNSRMTFGQIIQEARKKKDYNLRELASLITKEDGEPITHQYLSELENDRCNPPSDGVLKQLATELEIPLGDLYIKARRFPPAFDAFNETHIAAAKAMLAEIDDKLAA